MKINNWSIREKDTRTSKTHLSCWFIVAYKNLDTECLLIYGMFNNKPMLVLDGDFNLRDVVQHCKVSWRNVLHAVDEIRTEQA